MRDNLVQLNADGSFPNPPDASQVGQYPKIGVTPGHRLQVEAVVTTPAVTDEKAATVTESTKTVPTAGTAVRLTAASTKVDAVLIVPLRTNTGSIYIGTASGSAAQHVPVPVVIQAPEGTYIDLTNFYVDASVNGEGVAFIALS